MTALHLLPTLPDIDADDSRGRGVLASARGVFPLVAMEVEADVTGLVAAMTIRQTFANPYPDPLEASYIFPLPDRAAVTGFHITVGGRRIAGEIRERQAARDAYDQAVAAGQRAALLEEDRPDVFTTHVGNLASGEEATIELALSGPVACELGEATVRVPLVVAPRYVPGQPLDGQSVGEGTEVDTDAVPDASRITPPRLAPGADNPVRLSITVRLDPAGLPARDLRCSLPGASVSGSFPAATTVDLQPGQRLDRDFILRYRVADESSGVSAVAIPDAGDSDEGTYVVTVVPPLQAATARPRDVVLLLDRSGSMGGWKMVAARRAASRIVDSLTSADRFTVLAFDHVVERPSGLVGSGLAAATERHRYQAVEWLGRLEARGGTEMAAALAQADRDLAQGGPGHGTGTGAGTGAGTEAGSEVGERVQCCILVTDGQVGNEDQLVRMAADAGVRLYTVGIDQAVNAGLLQRLAAATAGRCDLVESEDRLDTVLAELHRRIGQPVAESVSLRFEGLTTDAATQVPRGGADLFPGVPLTISGRYRGRPGGRVVAGDAAGAWTATAEVAAATNPAAAAVWARSHLRDLEDRYLTADTAPGAERDALAARIVEVSLRYRVLCRFTGWVAVDESGQRVEGTRRRVVQPVEMPSGWAVPTIAATAPRGAVFGAAPTGGAVLAGGSFDATMAPLPPHQPTAPPGAPQAPKLWPAARPMAGPAPLAAPRLSQRMHKQATPTPPPTSATVPVSAYRARLDELLAEIGRSNPAFPGEPQHRVLARDARRLASDLESVRDLLPAPWRQVSELLNALASALSDGDREAVDSLLERISDAVASAGQEVDASPAGDRGRSRVFWR